MEECELIRADSLQNDLSVEGEFATEETMVEWGWNPFLVFDFTLWFLMGVVPRNLNAC